MKFAQDRLSEGYSKILYAKIVIGPIVIRFNERRFDSMM